jgi:hypothetical protein
MMIRFLRVGKPGGCWACASARAPTPRLSEASPRVSRGSRPTSNGFLRIPYELVFLITKKEGKNVLLELSRLDGDDESAPGVQGRFSEGESDDQDPVAQVDELADGPRARQPQIRRSARLAARGAVVARNARQLAGSRDNGWGEPEDGPREVVDDGDDDSAGAGDESDCDGDEKGEDDDNGEGGGGSGGGGGGGGGLPASASSMCAGGICSLQQRAARQREQERRCVLLNGRREQERERERRKRRQQKQQRTKGCLINAKRFLSAGSS